MSKLLETEETKLLKRKKFIVYFLILVFLLSETSKVNKEQALLYYKFFKFYFVEKEKDFHKKIIRNYERTKFFKNICKHILKSSNKNINNIDDVTDTLFKNNVTYGKT